jgi:hypothetical protein
MIYTGGDCDTCMNMGVIIVIRPDCDAAEIDGLPTYEW